MGDHESAPLISSEKVDPSSFVQPERAAPPAYTEVVGGQAPADAQYRQSAVCEVCRANLTYTGRADLRVIRCNRCLENTAVGPPVPGSRFVRCQCNALLTCSDAAKIIICSRANCNRKTRIQAVGVAAASRSAASATVPQRITCPQCHITVPWTGRTFGARRCYSCNTQMPITVGIHSYAMRQGKYYIGVGLFFLIMATAATVLSVKWANEYGGVVVTPVGFFLCAIILLLRGMMYCCSVKGAPIV